MPRWPGPDETVSFRPFRSAGRHTTALVLASGSRLEEYERLLGSPAWSGPFGRVRVISGDTATPTDVHGALLVIGAAARISGWLASTPYGAADLPRAGEVLRVTSVNPYAPAAPLIVVAGGDDQAAQRFLEGAGRFWRADYALARGDHLVRYGQFARSGGRWRIDDDKDVDLRPRIRSFDLPPLRVWYVDGRLEASRARAEAERARETLLAHAGELRARDLPLLRRAGAIDLHLYADLEDKGVRTGDPRSSHLSVLPGAPPRVHAVVNPSPAAAGPPSDGLGLAGAAVHLAAGRPVPRAVAEGAALLLAGSLHGRGLAWWEARVGPPALPDDAAYAGRSYQLAMPEAALYLRSLRDARPDLWARILAMEPAGIAALPPVATTRRKDPVAATRRARIAGFQRGIALAHEGYAVVDGYGSRAAGRELARLRRLGADAVAISPYGFMPSAAAPGIRFPRESAQAAGGENDVAVLESMREAHRLGLRVMLKPQIWLGRGAWTGAIAMSNEDDWKRFFEEYAMFLRHYALLAAAGDADLLVVGVELESTTSRGEDWRRLIAVARRVYDGPLTYAANWGREFETLSFWDALDYVGLDCYYPLHDDGTATDEELEAGARRVAAAAGEVARRAGRPLILTEVGFPALAGAWTSPHDERTGRPPDATAQARSYRAILTAFWGEPWLAGLYWWKWPSTPIGQREEPPFSPRGRLAEDILSEWYTAPRRGAPAGGTMD